MGADTVLAMIVQGGSFALLAWVVYHAVTKALPDRDKAFLASLDRNREEFMTEMRAVRENDRHRTQQFFTALGTVSEKIDDVHDTMRTHIFAQAIIQEAHEKAEREAKKS